MSKPYNDEKLNRMVDQVVADSKRRSQATVTKSERGGPFGDFDRHPAPQISSVYRYKEPDVDGYDAFDTNKAGVNQIVEIAQVDDLVRFVETKGS